MNEHGVNKFLSPEKKREVRKIKIRNWSMGRGWGYEKPEENFNFFKSELHSINKELKFSSGKNEKHEKNEKNDKFNNLYPLLPKRSFMTNSKMNFFSYKHDPIKNLKDLKFNPCKSDCAVFCSKSTYHDLIKKENEEDIKIKIFSNYRILSILIFILAIIISLSQYCFYRKFSNSCFLIDKFNIKNSVSKNSYHILSSQNTSQFHYVDYNNISYLTTNLKNNNSKISGEYIIPHSFISNITDLNSTQYTQGFHELNIIAWKYQITLFLLIVYIYLSGIIIRNKYRNDRDPRDDYKKDSSLHIINMRKSFTYYFNQHSLKISILSALSSYLFLLSTRYLPITLCFILFNSGDLVSEMFNYNKENKNLIYKMGLFILVSSICCFTFLNENQGISVIFGYDKIYYSLAVLSLVFSGLLIKYIRLEINKLMLNYAPIEIGYLLILNSSCITSFSFMSVELLVTGSISNKIIYWLVDIKNCFFNVLFLGILSTLGIILNFYMSIYLDKDMIKLFVYFEILLADFFSVQLFGLHEYLISSNYYFMIFSYLIAKYLMDYEKKQF